MGAVGARGDNLNPFDNSLVVKAPSRLMHGLMTFFIFPEPNFLLQRELRQQLDSSRRNAFLSYCMCAASNQMVSNGPFP